MYATITAVYRIPKKFELKIVFEAPWSYRKVYRKINCA